MYKLIENGLDTNIVLYFHALCWMANDLWHSCKMILEATTSLWRENAQTITIVGSCSFLTNFFLDQTWWENTDQPWLWSPIKPVKKMLLLITSACIRVMEERNIQEHLRDGFRSLVCVTSHHRMPWCQITVPTHHPSFACRSRSRKAILHLIILKLDLQTVFWQMHMVVVYWNKKDRANVGRVQS